MTENELLDEIVARINRPAEVAKGEITAADYIERIGCTHDTAVRHLDTLVRQGILSKRPAMKRGRPCNAYRKVEP